ncbi:MAG: hypothetical protein ACTSYL_12580 [Candidatus Thorarchaeota archaeon]
MTENGSHDDLELSYFESSNITKLDVIGTILAAIYGVSSTIPISTFFGAFGVTSTALGFSICIAPLFGILLGPYRGFAYGLVAGLIQGALATVVPTAGLALLNPPIILGPAISGLFTGLALQRFTSNSGQKVPGPLFTAIYLVIIIVLYEIPNYTAWWFMLPYALAAIIALVLQIYQIEFDPEKEGWRRYAQVLPFTFIGTMTDFSMMTMGAVYLMAVPAVVFGTVIFPFMLGERIAATVVSTIIAFVVLATFRDVLITRKNR